MKTNYVSHNGWTRCLAAYFWAFSVLSLAFFTTAHAQTLTTLQSFTGTNGAFPNTSVTPPVKSHHRVCQHTNGNFYGTTPFGGAYDLGVVYQETPASSGGVVTTIFSFNGTDGEVPESTLVVGSDGNLYGTTELGGANGLGTVFKITTTGTLTTLHSFSGADGEYPIGALVQGSNGNFYGATYAGGNSTGSGTIFEITSGGSLTTLYSFSGPDGAQPEGDLVQSPWNGNFYGVTFAGGSVSSNYPSGAGTAFQISSSGALSTVYDFCTKTNCNDGAYPQGPLSPDSNGNFYGTTFFNGAYAAGTLFQINTYSLLHTLYHFCSKGGSGVCLDGAEPAGGPVVGNDGNLYGVTLLGGTNYAEDGGTLYQFTPWGVLNTFYNFCSKANCADGQEPEAPLVQGSDQNFYGSTAFGGTDNYGTSFILATVPSSGFNCNGSYSGEYWGNITVSSGQNCEWIDGGQIYGNIYVNGGNLNLSNSSVFGNVQIMGGTYTLGPSLTIASTLSVQNVAASGSTQNSICGVTTGGSLYFDGNGTPALIGSNGSSCAGNSIGGDLEVAGSTAAVQVYNNSANDDLNCSSNSSVTGGGNTAKNKIGQCSSF